MEETNLDFRTPLQKERGERDRKMHARFMEIKDKSPKGSLFAAWRVIGEEFGLKPQGVRYGIERETKRLKAEESKS